MFKIMRLFAAPVLAAVVLAAPAAIAPREAPAARAAVQYRVFGPYLSYDLALKWADILRGQGWTVVSVFETPYDPFGVDGPVTGWAISAYHP